MVMGRRRGRWLGRLRRLAGPLSIDGEHDAVPARQIYTGSNGAGRAVARVDVTGRLLVAKWRWTRISVFGAIGRLVGYFIGRIGQLVTLCDAKGNASFAVASAEDGDPHRRLVVK